MEQGAKPVGSPDDENAPASGAETPSSDGEDVSRYCPVCSRRLESRSCKLVCNGCGYYMSCADYY